MNYLSICSGIEAASVAWHPLGWKPLAFSEIEAFPSAVLAHHYPKTPNLGDLTKYHEWPDPGTLRPDLIVGGTPCQAFSVAGLRRGLDDPRGNLTLVFLGLLARYRPRWVVWENVPGVLSDRTGAFGAFLGGLGELGYGFAYRVLDAQFFGVAQRRRRVFVVGHLGDWRRAAAVLFEPESLRGDSPPRRESGERAAESSSGRAGDGGWRRVSFAADCDGYDEESGELGETCSICGLDYCEECECPGPTQDGFEYYEDADGVLWARPEGTEDGAGRGTPLVPEVAGCLQHRDAKGADSDTKPGHLIPIAFNARQDPDHWEERTGPLDTHGSTQAVAYGFQPRIARNGRGDMGDLVNALNAQSGETGKGDAAPCVAVAFAQNQRDEVRELEVAGALAAEPGMKQQTFLATTMAVRRLTPRECERLQGFPDDYTRIPYRGKPAEDCPDGPRYKALGNSMAVPVMRWIGRRIQSLENR